MTPAAAPPRAVLSLLVLALLLAGCAGPSPEQVRAELLDLVPAEALERGVAVWEGGLEDGYRSVRPSEALWSLLGVEADEVEAVAETGGSPFTALRIATPAGRVVEAATAGGYDSAEVAGWTVLRRAPGGGGQLDAAIPAAAVRRGALLIGPAEAVAAIVDGGPVAGGVPWVAAVADAAGDGDVLLAPGAAALEEAAQADGGAAALLERAGARGDLPTWEGWAALRSDGDGGALVVVVGPGAADADDAQALALRAATGPVVGGGRRAGDVLDGGAPRFDADAGVLRLPVTWRIDAPRLRRDVEQGAFAFLLPSP